MVLHDIPNDGIRHAVIFMPQDVSDTGYLSPRYLWLALLQLRRQTPYGFRDNLDATLHPMAEKPIGGEVR